MLLAAVGIVRLPDLFTRMHAATKPATLGTALTMLAVAVHFGELGVTTRALLVVVFFVITAPVGAHMIGRAAYLAGVPLWEGTILDERRHRGDGRPRPPDDA
jgi:multicomponent Na+:H+ antiporter subunit G